MKRTLAIEIICFLFIVLFLYTAGTKFTDYGRFVAQLGKSPLLTNYAAFIAWTIPSIEVIVAIMLMIPRFRLSGMYASFTLMVMFTLYVAAILTFSKELPCSCGGVISALGWWQHLLFNTGFTILGLIGITLMKKNTEQPPAIIITA